MLSDLERKYTDEKVYRKQTASEAGQKNYISRRIINNKKRKAAIFFEYKKESLFHSRVNKKKNNFTQIKGLPSYIYIKGVRKEINMVEAQRDCRKIAFDSSVQYRKTNIPVYIPYTKEDFYRKFGHYPIDNNEDSVLDEIRSMQKKGL